MHYLGFLQRSNVQQHEMLAPVGIMGTQLSSLMKHPVHHGNMVPGDLRLPSIMKKNTSFSYTAAEKIQSGSMLVLPLGWIIKNDPVSSYTLFGFLHITISQTTNNPCNDATRVMDFSQQMRTTIHQSLNYIDKNITFQTCIKCNCNHNYFFRKKYTSCYVIFTYKN